MAILDEPDIKPLADAIRNEIDDDPIKKEFEVPTRQWAIDDIVLEAVFAILGFEDWYFDNESSRNDWVPSELKDYSNKALYGDVKKYVEDSLEELREAEDLPNEPDVETLVNSLVGLAVEWPGWYYQLRRERDTIDWYLQKGANDEIYLENADPFSVADYGNIETNMGTGNVYDEDEFLPFDFTDLEGEVDNPELLSPEPEPVAPPPEALPVNPAPSEEA